MNYKMKAWIANPRTPEGMVSELYFELDYKFAYNENQYGNGHYVSITGKGFSPQYYDIRYDRTFNRDKKEEWLKDWANGYWSGKGYAWKLKRLEVEKA